MFQFVITGFILLAKIDYRWFILAGQQTRRRFGFPLERRRVSTLGLQRVSRDNLELSCVFVTLPHFCCVLCCADLSVCRSDRFKEVFLSNSTRTPTLGNEGCSTNKSTKKVKSFYKSFIGNATNATINMLSASGWWSCYRRSWNHAQVHGMYLGFLGFLGFDIWCPYSRVCGVLGSLHSLHPQRSTLLHFVFCFPVPVFKHLQ